MASVYRQVPKECLVRWMDTPEYAADYYATYDTVTELENGSTLHQGVYSLSSIKAGLRSITRQLGLNDEVYDVFEYAIINDDDGINEIFDYIGNELKQVPDINGFVLNALADIHNQWVVDNSSERAFRRKKSRGQLHQYAPLELIGWNEVLSDWVFLEPILECLGIYINENDLREYYNNKILEYATDKDITCRDDIATLVSTGSKYYPILPDELAINLRKDNHEVANTIVNNLVKDNSPLLETIGLSQEQVTPRLN